MAQHQVLADMGAFDVGIVDVIFKVGETGLSEVQWVRYG